MLVPLMKFLSVLSWSAAAVLFAGWLRTVARMPRLDHVGHAVDLLAGLVPLACAVVLVVLAGGLIGLPSVVGFVFVFLPVGLALTLFIELRRIEGAVPAKDRWRAGLSLGLAASVLLARGGL